MAPCYNTYGIRHNIESCDVFLLKEQLIKFLIKPLKELSAEELMVIYQQNSPTEAYEAFTELYSRFNEKVFSYVLNKIKNQADSEDLLQKIFIKVHESKHLYNMKYKFEQWLFVIARTAVLDFYRAESRYKKRMTKVEINPEISPSEYDTTPLNSLAEDQKEMLEMKFIDELSYQEMAALLNKSETSLRKMVSRMMINLRKGDV